MENIKNNIPANTERLEAVVAAMPQRKLMSFGIIETTPQERGIFKRLDAVITELMPKGCPILTHGKPDCSFCELLAIQQEIKPLI